MTSALIVDGVLVALALGLALWVTAADRAYWAVIGFVAYGLLLTLAWVRLGAMDVAMTEAALGSGLTGLLLLGAAGRLAPLEAGGARQGPAPALRLLVGLLCTAVAVGLGAVVLALPDPAPTLAPIVAANLAPTGVGNPVTAVLMAHRAIDTLLETLVLLPALVGIWSLATDQAWGGRPGAVPVMAHDSALILLAQVLPPLGILVAIHLVWAGADEPGGKFQGATVLAAMWVLVIAAGLRRPPTLGPGPLRPALVLGALTFLVIGLTGLGFADAFLAYPAGYAKPLILVIEAAATLSVALALGLLLAGPPVADRPLPGAGARGAEPEAGNQSAKNANERE